MRFLITTNRVTDENHPENNGWKVTIQQDQWTSDLRFMREARHLESNQTYPLPPNDAVPAESEGALLHELCTGADAGSIKDLLEEIVETREPTEEQIQACGQYLFHCMIGDNLWQQLLDRAGAEEIELALCWSSGETLLQRLPWEMMRTNLAYLTTGTQYKAAVTRFVSDGKAQPATLKEHPRLLLVIGCGLDDPRISPGAEYLGLMRAIEADVVGGRRSLESRILESASPHLLESTVAEFRPHVVHFICHGEEGALRLQFESDDSRYLQETQRCDAQTLVEKLRGTDGNVPLPQIVVLNACKSGAQIWAQDETCSLASKLVQLGVPIVTAMGGKVRDSACRLFSRAFGTALLQGHPLVPSAAAGRRSAFGTDGPRREVDWIFPQLFLSSKVDPEYSPLDRELVESEKQITAAISNYQLVLKDEPRFSVNFSALEDCYAILRDAKNPATPGVLAIVGNRGLGKTRILQEMTIIALRQKQFPVSLIDPSSQDEACSLWDVVNNFAGALMNVADAHGVNGYDNLQTVRLQKWQGNGPRPNDLSPGVSSGFMFGTAEESVTTLAILTAMFEDAYFLLGAARQKDRRPIAGDAIPLLLIDDFHLYPQTFIQEFFTKSEQRKTTGHFGIGNEEHPMPVVVTVDDAAPFTAKVTSHVQQTKAWVQANRIEPFAFQNLEDLTVYGRVLLHPFNDDLFDGSAWVKAAEPSLQDLEVLRDAYPESDRRKHAERRGQPVPTLDRIPLDFNSYGLDWVVRYGHIFQKANDTDVMHEIMK